jgi:DMSO/TMAO reductase YedYZ molybdopterin-dependent catalytic subunit
MWPGMSLVAIDGEISIPRTFTFAELTALPQQVEERSMLLGGRAIRGVRLGAVLAQLGIKPWARFAVIRAHDGYAANIDVAAIGDCLLIYAIGDEPLPAELGGPVRLMTRGLGRCANVKNVASVSFAVAPIEIEHACPHEIARRRRGWVVLAGGES